jgi:hypothetical protein
VLGFFTEAPTLTLDLDANEPAPLDLRVEAPCDVVLLVHAGSERRFFDPRAEQWKHGGVAWTIKDGILFDAQALLREAEWYVREEKGRSPPKTTTH